MKLQQLSVVFVIIILPIILVMSIYTNNLVKVANAESNYNKILMNSTYDAVRAYQINTLDNTYASVNESRIRDVRASTNTFFNSLASGLSESGLTKEELNDYVPAILFTLYDGYYIYTPYSNIASSTSKGANFSTSGSVTENMEFNFKPFTYYSCEYKSKTGEAKSFDIVVNYTLDNYISVMGTFEGKYFTASGYYINPESVTNINDSDKSVTITKNSKSITMYPEVLGEYISTVDQVEQNRQTSYTTPYTKYYRYVNYNEEKYYYDDSPNTNANSYQNIPIFYLQNNIKVYISKNMEKELNDYGINTSSMDSFKDVNYYHYYKDAKQFSESVYDKIKYISADDAITDYFTKDYKVYLERFKEKDAEKGSAHIKTELKNDDAYIFDYKKGKNDNDPELESSSFNNHRIDVIISTIQANLTTSIANFNNYLSGQYEFAMPTLTEDDWYKIANNVTVVTFMQGMVVGNYKFYNGYSVVANTKNKEYVSRNSIYVENLEDPPVYENNSNQYHTPGCVTYNNYINSANNQNVSVVGYRNIDYELQNYKNNKQAINYYLQPQTSAYECVVSRNQSEFTSDDYFGFKDKSVEIIGDDGKTKEVTINEKIRTAYIQALAREKGASSKNLSNLNLYQE